MAEEVRRDSFRDIRDERNRLLLRFDARRDIVEVKPGKGPPVRVDLTQHRGSGKD